MTFQHAWALPFLLLPLVWAWYEWGRTRRDLALALKTLSILAIIAALAEPVLTVPETKMAVAVLVDTSASVTQQDLSRASQYVSGVDRAHGRNWLRILPFGRSVRDFAAAENRGLHLQLASGDVGRATDLESSIEEAIGSLPSGLIPRVVLISDGHENAGSITRAAWQARRLGIPIDTVPMQGRPQPRLRLESVSLPTTVFTGEQFPIDLTIVSPSDASALVQITAEGRALGSNPVKLEQGENQIRVHASIATAGALNLAGEIQTNSLGDIQFDRALTLRRPKILYVSQDPAGTETNLLQTLASAQFDIDRAGDPSRGALNDYQIVILNNIDLESLPAERKDELEKFVQQGGGLLVIAGERNIYAQNKKAEDALDRTLPAKLAPPRSPEGTAVVLIIDKSSSMEGKKIELARQAAIGVVDHLRPIDTVGVLIFDNSFQWDVPMRHAEDKALIKRLISGIIPDGGTQIAPALTEAYRKVLPTNATFKHIVLLTDGISEEGDSLDLSKQAAAQHVTISTVGLGQDVNRIYLEKVAAVAGGKSYFLNDPSGLEQIVLKDVMEHTGTSTVEKSLQPIVAKQAEILDGVGMETAPPLKGYVRFISKPGSDTILKIDENDPLLVRWQYGLGRAVIFTSDAKSRWAANWITWKGYDKFWTNTIRDLLPHTESSEAKAEFDSAGGDLVVSYHLGTDIDDPETPPDIFVLGPNGFRHRMSIAKLAGKSYRGRIHIGDLQGLFRVRPLEDSRAFPEIGYYRPEQELLDYGSNQFLLRSVSNYTGGHFDPAPKQVFDSGGRSEASTLRLWPALLVLAILLNLAELLMRKVPRQFLSGMFAGINRSA